MVDDDKHILEHAAVLNHLPHKLKTHNILLLASKCENNIIRMLFSAVYNEMFN